MVQEEENQNFPKGLHTKGNVIYIHMYQGLNYECPVCKGFGIQTVNPKLFRAGEEAISKFFISLMKYT